MEETNVSYAMDSFKIGVTIVLVFLNGFFVAAEFALVKISRSKLKIMVREKQLFAPTAMWLFKRQNLALSACQLGITMASLALGWIGEPAIAHLITPLIHSIGITSEGLIHGLAFTIAFTIITSLHIVIGEQVPKIYAIRRPGPVFLGSAALLKGFYILLYPFMYLLDGVSNVVLKWLGIDGSGEHDAPLSEEEIRASLSIAHAKGELSKNEHKLLNAVFHFDDEVARKIMVPRNEIQYLDASNSFDHNVRYAKDTRHSRFPLCEGSLDKVTGVVHIKNLIGYQPSDNINLQSIARTPLLVPENIPLAKLLQEFRSTKQHLAFVQDEHGTLLGIVTLENVLESLVGNLQDEFDNEPPEIIDQRDGKFLIDGDVSLDEMNERFNLELEADDADTLSGFIVERFGHKLKPGKILNLEEGIEVEIIAVDGIRMTKLKLKKTGSN